MYAASEFRLALTALIAAGIAGSSFGQASITAVAKWNVHGDFDGDGYADLAVGIPQQKVGSATWAGEAQIFYGSASGLSDRDQVLSEASFGYTAGSYERFGAAIAVGNFDNDPYSDLAIGAPGESIGSISSAGIVIVVYGSSLGLNPSRKSMFNQNTGIIGDTSGSGDGFGSALASGDFNNNSYDDLLIGVPFEDVNSISNSGAMWL